MSRFRLFHSIIIGVLVGYSSLAFSKVDPEKNCRVFYKGVYLSCSEIGKENDLQVCETHAHNVVEKILAASAVSREQGEALEGLCLMGCRAGIQGEIAPYEVFRKTICRLGGSPEATRPGPEPHPPTPRAELPSTGQEPNVNRPTLPPLFETPTQPQKETPSLRQRQLQIKLDGIMGDYIKQAEGKCRKSLLSDIMPGVMSVTDCVMAAVQTGMDPSFCYSTTVDRDCIRSTLSPLAEESNVRQIMNYIGASPEEYDLVLSIIINKIEKGN